MNSNALHLHRIWLQLYGANSIQEFYTKVNQSNKMKDKLGIDKLPFPLSAMEGQAYVIRCHPLVYSILCRFSDYDYYIQHAKEVKELIQTLKKNPPNECFKNPELPAERSYEDKKLSNHIFCFGIDLPGSMFNPYGNLEYWGNFFIDMFFGNYTVSMEHINNVPSQDLKRELERRLGYCQFSPIFAPILGFKMVNLDKNPYLTNKEKEKFKTLYSGNNENRHLEILEKLLELGADVNAYDINGYTPLHHALNPVLCCDRESVVRLLLKFGAQPYLTNPNPKSTGFLPVTLFFEPETEEDWRIVDMLIEQYKIVNDVYEVHHLRIMLEEGKYSKDLAVRWREAFPRDQNKCENSRCFEKAEKKCGACGKVVYCTPACQKLDWTFHKITCHKITCRKTKKDK